VWLTRINLGVLGGVKTTNTAGITGGAHSSDELGNQLLRPTLGLRPWLALLRRAFAFFFCVRFDMPIRISASP
jgi:hypothetical protein